MNPQFVLKLQLLWKTVSADGMTFFACLYACKYDIVICDQEMNSFFSRILYNNHDYKDLLQHYTKTMANTTYDSLWKGDKKQLIDLFDPYLPLKNYNTQS